MNSSNCATNHHYLLSIRELLSVPEQSYQLPASMSRPVNSRKRRVRPRRLDVGWRDAMLVRRESSQLGASFDLAPQFCFGALKTSGLPSEPLSPTAAIYRETGVAIRSFTLAGLQCIHGMRRSLTRAAPSELSHLRRPHAGDDGQRTGAIVSRAGRAGASQVYGRRCPYLVALDTRADWLRAGRDHFGLGERDAVRGGDVGRVTARRRSTTARKGRAIVDGIPALLIDEDQAAQHPPSEAPLRAPIGFR